VRLKLQTLALVVGLVGISGPLSAHHAWPVSYSKLVTVKGTVMEFTWANPHPMISLDVRSSDGKAEKWSVGGPALNRMENNGWNRTTVKLGDVITATGYQFADGQKVLRLEKVIMPDGKEMFLYGRR
jgi:hypothetical protein